MCHYVLDRVVNFRKMQKWHYLDLGLRFASYAVLMSRKSSSIDKYALECEMSLFGQ